MNIKEAKQQIENAMRSYFTKDEFGKYIIPVERQRPIFLMGPPGIGKTAIMEQVASDLGVGLVSYSMTHHTRQSALGLPFIEKKNYGGKEYSVSEYTMSEIIASVYEMMEQTGVKEGILFLDEINCVSETLAPAMLQFLQYKIFGRHRVPEGWIVVTAGNPPEYNNSVREFDIVTWDRLKRIDIEPNYEVWKEYAYKKGVHAAITTYLDIKKSDFYKIETTVDGKSFVTARGWSDLSDMMRLYERHKITVDEKLIAQYLQNKKIAKDFAIYYDLFNKYKSDYSEGKKVYDLGTKRIIVSLTPELTLSLFDELAQKEIKSIPKKGTDPELAEKAAADFAEMKKNAKKVVKGRNDVLFEEFLSGKTRAATSWIASYTKNPLLRQVAKLIVWVQGKATFTLTETGAIDCNGTEYVIDNDTKIGVAHPIEMKKTEVEAWQKYFTAHGLKQPFSQIWEPAVDKTSIAEDRYKGCLIPFYRFRGQAKHGISVEDYDFHNER